MKKYFLSIIFMIILFSVKDVHAFGISTANNTVYIGSTIGVNVDMSDLTGKFTISSSNQGVLRGGNSDWYENQSTVIYFDAVGTGQATITVYSNNPSNKNGENQGEVSRSITINVIERPVYTPIEINRTYSDNNYISSLAIDGYEIKPEFNKDVLEYSLELDYTVEKINISANPEDERTTINGLGEKEVNEGNNEIKITAVAENGNERVYTINVLVKEIDPIEVKVNGKKYTLLKKESLLPKVDDFDKKTIKIDNKNIPALYNVKTKYTLVGLKDDKGQIELYIYNDKDKSYTKYNEISFNGLRVNFLENNNNNYKEVTIKINGQHINAYKKKGLDYYLVYGMNIKTGKKNWYTYDKEEKTLQRYIDSSNLSTDFDKNFIILLGSISGVLIFFLFVLSIKYKTKKIS